jgi:prepilin-type N-terminal cleavage/methylation domain-containing protein
MGRVSRLRRLRCRACFSRRPGGEQGFTLIELIVAISILAVTLLVLAYGIFGSMGALAAARQRSTFLELANAEVEAMRALNYSSVGVSASDLSSATGLALYPGGEYLGRDAVVVATTKPAMVSEVADAAAATGIEGLVGGYKVTRRVTWSNPAGTDSPRAFKRLDVHIEWQRANGATGNVTYTSIYYPGNLGTAPPPTPPTASFVATPAVGVIGQTFTFDAAGSVAGSPSLSISGYAWDFGDGTTGTGQSVTKEFTGSPGARVVTLVVTQSSTPAQSSAPVSQQVLVGAAAAIPPAAPNGPTAAFSADPVTGTAPLNIGVDASASSDPDGDPLTYSWNWGDGSALGSGVAPSHTYATEGTRTITLTVTDPAGQSSTATRSVTATGITCSVISAKLQNPEGYTPENVIRTTKQGAPINSSLFFEVVTTSACESATVTMPHTRGTFTVTLAGVATTGSTPRVFTGTYSIPNNLRFSTGTTQSATVKATKGTAESLFTFTFRAQVP